MYIAVGPLPENLDLEEGTFCWGPWCSPRSWFGSCDDVITGVYLHRTTSSTTWDLCGRGEWETCKCRSRVRFSVFCGPNQHLIVLSAPASGPRPGTSLSELILRFSRPIFISAAKHFAPECLTNFGKYHSKTASTCPYYKGAIGDPPADRPGKSHRLGNVMLFCVLDPKIAGVRNQLTANLVNARC